MNEHSAAASPAVSKEDPSPSTQEIRTFGDPGATIKSGTPARRRRSDDPDLRLMFATYADILFILLPYLMVTLFRIWQADIKTALGSYDLAVAAAVLSGLALVKFILAVLLDTEVRQYRERVMFLIAVTVVVVLVPSLMSAILLLQMETQPEFALFTQPMLLVIAIAAYTGAVFTTHRMQRRT